ncbi:hypothetical protein KR044_000731, partial [Drosophila immigrans]
YSPALKATAKKMHMSEHLAGVTLLAFGNSTSDFLGQLQNSHLDQIFTYMLANAILITLISGGLVCYLWPTQLPKYETVRTLLFFMLGAVSVEYMFNTDSSLTIHECMVSLAVIICIYIIYLLIEIIEGYIEKRADRAIVILERRGQYSQRRTTLRRSTIRISNQEKKERLTINDNVTRNVDYRTTNSKNANLFDGFVETIQPIEEEQWHNCGLAVRVGLLILAPLQLLFLLLIPIVDLERKRHGWSKLLNCIQIVVTPMYVTGIGECLSEEASSSKYFTLISSSVFFRTTPFMVYEVCITIPIAIAVFLHSRTDIPPAYHFVNDQFDRLECDTNYSLLQQGFVILSYIGSILLLYICTIEMNEILQVIGLILGLSTEFIAATISCWGSSICTIVINVILAQHGYGAMAIAASYAGPFFSFIMAMGILPSYRHIMGTYEGVATSYYLLAYVFLIISLTSSLIWSLLFNFYGRRSVGIYNIIIYMLYIVFCTLAEVEFIHSYAVD